MTKGHRLKFRMALAALLTVIGGCGGWAGPGTSTPAVVSTAPASAPATDPVNDKRLVDLLKERRFLQLDLDETVNAQQRQSEYSLNGESYHQRRQELDDRLAERGRYDSELLSLRVSLQVLPASDPGYSKMLTRESELEAAIESTNKRISRLALELGSSAGKYQEPRVLEEKARRLRGKIEAIDAEILRLSQGRD